MNLYFDALRHSIDIRPVLTAALKYQTLLCVLSHLLYRLETIYLLMVTASTLC